jgi:hypothetical protein
MLRRNRLAAILTVDGSFLIDIDDQVQDLLKVARDP